MINYELRGRCKELSEKLVSENTNLILIRGWYNDPQWGRQEHWWCKDSSTGKIIDPTVDQFPFPGITAFYEEYKGIVVCESCGKELSEEGAIFYGNFSLCSHECVIRLVL